MTSLYNCRHDGDQYRVTKFDTDWNVEASYLCDLVACECPAGHRPKCRHREMLPKFIQRGHVGDEWFWDHDRGGWVQGASVEIEPSQDLAFEEEDDTLDELEIAEMADGVEKDNALAPAGLGQASELRPPYQQTPPLLGGFPYDCYDNLCTTPGDCIINGCVEGNGTPPREPSPSLPKPTIRRRV